MPQPVLTSSPAEKAQPLYRQVESYLRGQIQDRKIRPGSKLDSPDKLSRRLKVSKGVVQQALQSLASRGIVVRKPRSGTYVSEDAVRHIDSHLPTTRNVVLVVPNVQIPEYARLARGVEDAARAKGLDLVVASTDNFVERYEHVILRQIESNAFGLVIAPPIDGRLSTELILKIQEAGLPVVACMRAIDGSDWPSVQIDGAHCGELAARHLIELGRSHLAMVATTFSDFYVDRFYHGFTRVIMDRMGRVAEFHELRVDVTASDGDWLHPQVVAQHFEQFLQSHPALDGIACTTDVLAERLMQVADRLGVRVPDDAAILSNGNFFEYAHTFHHDLTTVEWRFDRMGQAAIDHLIAQQQRRPLPAKSPTYIPGDLLVRRSTVGKPPEQTSEHVPPERG